MIITAKYFIELDLENNDIIDLVTETGERFIGRFRGEYDGKSFKYYNNTRGYEEVVSLQDLQRLVKA